MKAALVTSPGQLEITDVPMPEIGKYQVLCEHLYGAICAGTDRHLIKGNLPIPGIEYPLVLGHETIGRVVEVGDGVTSFSKGDLITRTGYPASEGLSAFWGGFSEYGIATDGIAMRDAGVDTEDWSPHMINQRLPADVDPAAATMMITWRETYSYLSRMGVGDGCSVLVLGSGGNGFSFAVLARCLGASRVVMLGNPHWSDTAARAGIDRLVDYRSETVEDDLRGDAGSGFDFIIDAIGKTGGLEDVVSLLKPGGKIGLYGIEDLGERMGYLNKLGDDGLDARGPGDYSEAESHDVVVDLLQSGRLDAGIWFDPRQPKPLDQFMDAIDDINQKKSLKALIQLGAS